MRIQEAAARSGLSAETLRYYERSGVLPRPPRRENGYRAYTEEHLATLRLARGLRELDLPLDAIRAILPVAHDGTCRELRGRLLETVEGAIAATDTRLRELRRTRGRLREIQEGLRRMRPRETRVPDLRPCQCVQLVSVEERRAGARR